MRMIILFSVLTIVGLAAVAVVFIRFASHPVEVYHVDPLTAPTPETPNSFRVAPVLEGFDPVTEERVDLPAPVYEANPAIIAKALDEFALRQPRTIRIAGTPEQGWMTYVQTSDRMRYPDYVSVLIMDIANEGLTTIAIFSRSRFGYGDLGVNEARVRRWLQPLESFETTFP